MKKIFRLAGLSILILSGIFHSCKKDKIPVLTTSDISNITGISAICGGTITDEGSKAVTSRGVCWSTSAKPTILDDKTSDGSGSGDFTSNISGLVPDLTYYVRAYATNGAGTGYGEAVTFSTLLADYDGNVYTTAKIGIQTWMVENLKTTKYNDGTSIPLVTTSTSWSDLTTPGYSWYNNDASTYKNTYGALYNWYAVNTGKLCPTGWHVPTFTEWTTMTDYLTYNGFGYGGNGNDIAKSVAAKSGWQTSSVAGTVGNDMASNNSSGFSALPGGIFVEGKSYILGQTGTWWSTKVYDNSSSWSKQLNYSSSAFEDKVVYYNYCGLSVRCIKDYRIEL